MAIIHKARLVPTKLELLDAWLPTRPWYAGPATPATTRVAAFRFDDPDGEVGIETVLVRDESGGPLFQVPLTYRGAPLPGADAHLVGTIEHSVLGTRWVYDGTADPVYATALAHAILTGGTQADEVIAEEQRVRPSDCQVRGTGSATDTPAVTALPAVTDGDPAVITAEGLTLTVVRVVDLTATAGDAPRLEATFAGAEVPVTLAVASV